MLDINDSENRYLALNAIRAADPRHLWTRPATASQRRELPAWLRMPKPIAVTIIYTSEDTQPDEPEYAEREKLGFPGWYCIQAFRPGNKDKHHALDDDIKGFDDEAGISEALLRYGVEEGTPVFIWHDSDLSEETLAGVMLVERPCYIGTF
jgi:hypothetical protein